MQTYNTFKTYVSRLQKKMSFRRKKSAKSRLAISAPFDFKKEDTLCFLRGISSEELAVMREKAAASIVGSATSSPFPDSPPLPPSQAPGEMGHFIVRTQTANSANTTGTTGTGMATRRPSQPGRSYSQQHDYHSNGHSQAYNHRIGGPMAFHPVVLASTQPFTLAGPSSPSSSSSSSSINSFGRDRD